MSRNIKDLGKKLTLGENLNAFDRKSVYNQKLKISCQKIGQSKFKLNHKGVNVSSLLAYATVKNYIFSSLLRI